MGIEKFLFVSFSYIYISFSLFLSREKFFSFIILSLIYIYKVNKKIFPRKFFNGVTLYYIFLSIKNFSPDFFQKIFFYNFLSEKFFCRKNFIQKYFFQKIFSMIFLIEKFSDSKKFSA